MDRDELAARYLDHLPYAPYPVQEEALLAWFTDEQGVLVCAPTGTGKTLIAEAALFEALHTGKVAYYTTPLICPHRAEVPRARSVRFHLIAQAQPDLPELAPSRGRSLTVKWSSR